MLASWPLFRHGCLSLFVLCVALVARPLLAANIPSTELSTLYDFYNSTNGDEWRWHLQRGQHWIFNSAANPCLDEWQGVNCTYDSIEDLYHVSGISLERYNLSGVLSASIKHLPGLVTLALQDNDIGGSIPAEITELSLLQKLHLSLNNFNSTIPQNIGQLSNLTSLDLSNNKFSGSIPASIGSLGRLEELTFVHNHLAGRIPSSIGQLSSLRTLLLDDNKLTGQLPAAIGNLSQLMVLEIQINELSGTLPPSLGQLTSLVALGLSKNKITGTLPAELSGLTSVLQMNIEANLIHGPIPASLGALYRLQSLDLFDNKLSQAIPDVFYNLTNLVFFGVSQNALTGPVPLCISAMTSLQSLYLHDNDMTGTVPDYLGSLQYLEEMYLQNNYFGGEIPVSICNLTQLKDVGLGDNYMEGTIPRQITNVTTLETFVVDHNFLTGQIGSLFDPLRQVKLNSIQLNDNQLTGVFPPELFLLPGLVSLVAGSNCFHGTLPSTMCAANQLYSLVLDGMSSATSCRDTIFPRISNSYLLTRSVEGTIPECVFTLPILTTLHLSGNGLTGTLPSDITIPATLTDLVLSHNVLTGPIPANFQTRAWYSLDLSYNRLSGEFNPDFPCQTLVVLSEEELTSRYTADNSSVYLYNNFLSGVIPTCLKSYDKISILGTNLFSCDLYGHELPLHDDNKSFYECDSTLFNYSYYAWLAVWIVFAIVVFAVMRTRKLMFVTLKMYLDLAQRYFYYCGERLTVLDSLLRISVGTCLYVLVILLPLYTVLSERYGTLMHQYAWTTSAGYLSGKVPLVCLFLFWVLLLAVVLTVFRRMIKQHGTRAVKSVTAFESHSPLVYVAFIFVNIFIVLGVNIAYVYVAIYQSSALFVLCQIIMSFFKLLWNNIVSFNILHVIVHYISPRSTYRESDYATLLQVMALINTIVIPCLVVLCINPQCFYNVFVPAPTVKSRYLYQYCFITGPRGDCAVYIPKSAKTSFTPPFIYSFQCSSSFITYYAPAFVNMCLISAFVGPTLQYLQMSVAYRLHPDTFWHKFLVRLLPPILKPLPTTAEGESTPVPNPPYFHSTRATTALLCWIGLLFTFGAVFPPLAVALVVTIFANMVFVKVKVGRFLSTARALQLHDHVDVVEKECQNLGSVSVLHTSLWLLITISCWFYALFLFDTLGSATGFYRAYWVLIVMPLMPLVMYIVSKCVIALYRRHIAAVRESRRMPSGSIDGKDGAPRGFEMQNVYEDRKSTVEGTNEATDTTFNAILSSTS